jgi:hypothetical protein
MFSPAVSDEIRSKIKDDSVLDPKEYDPAGLESLETLVPPGLCLFLHQ